MAESAAPLAASSIVPTKWVPAQEGAHRQSSRNPRPFEHSPYVQSLVAWSLLLPCAATAPCRDRVQARSRRRTTILAGAVRAAHSDRSGRSARPDQGLCTDVFRNHQRVVQSERIATLGFCPRPVCAWG